MRQVVSDTGPLLHLGEAQVLLLLEQSGNVFIPKAVDLELSRYQAAWLSERPSWIRVEGLVSPYDGEAAQWQQAEWLHKGEAEAVALARQMDADWLLTDDAAARLFAQSLGLEVHGSLGIVLWATAQGHLQRAEAESALDRLAQSSLWISTRVLADAKAALQRLTE